MVPERHGTPRLHDHHRCLRRPLREECRREVDEFMNEAEQVAALKRLFSALSDEELRESLTAALRRWLDARPPGHELVFQIHGDLGRSFVELISDAGQHGLLDAHHLKEPFFYHQHNLGWPRCSSTSSGCSARATLFRRGTRRVSGLKRCMSPPPARHS